MNSTLKRRLGAALAATALAVGGSLGFASAAYAASTAEIVYGPEICVDGRTVIETATVTIFLDDEEVSEDSTFEVVGQGFGATGVAVVEMTDFVDGEWSYTFTFRNATHPEASKTHTFWVYFYPDGNHEGAEGDLIATQTVTVGTACGTDIPSTGPETPSVPGQVTVNAGDTGDTGTPAGGALLGLGLLAGLAAIGLGGVRLAARQR